MATQYPDLTTAGRELLEADKALKQARRNRDRALGAIHASGIAKGAVSHVAKESLRAAGFTPAEIQTIGVSPGAVRLALDRPR